MNRGHAWGVLVSALALASVAGVGSSSSGCKCERSRAPGPASSGSAGALDPELAAKVLARVGDREITLGDYAAALERMDRFERLRYQTPERREKLLEEMVNSELLAAEARRRGLDRDPAVRARIRQALRDELLDEMGRAAPGPEGVPDKAVRAYYDQHRADFATPERRRLSAIVTRERATAEQALQQARGGDAETWGRLVEKYSTEKQRDAGDAGLRGDLGFVTAARTGTVEPPTVPDEVRAAGFRIEGQGEVFGEVVEANGKYYVVRMVTKNEAGHRTFADAERSIRVTLAQRELREAEKRLEAELRKKHPVEVDEAALAEVQVPAGKD
jgi:hypothetical protein